MVDGTVHHGVDQRGGPVGREATQGHQTVDGMRVRYRVNLHSLIRLHLRLGRLPRATTTAEAAIR
jgi:hypothetical protein